MRDKSLDEMTAIGKTLGLAAVIAAGGHEPRLINLPHINKNETRVNTNMLPGSSDKFMMYSPKTFNTQTSSSQY